jgi:hypothetical protein
MKETIESNVSKAILQQQEDIIIGDETYRISPPSVATLILASEAISQLPSVKITIDGESIASESLCIAKDCRALGDIIAILILGAKRLTETREVVKKRFFGLIREKEEITVDNKAILARKLLENMDARELHELMAKLLRSMKLSDFFGLTTSLIEINLLRKTREVVTTTTVSGR